MLEFQTLDSCSADWRQRAARGALRMFPAARAKVEGEQPEARHSLPKTFPFRFITRLNHRVSVCGEVPADSWKHKVLFQRIDHLNLPRVTQYIKSDNLSNTEKKGLSLAFFPRFTAG